MREIRADRGARGARRGLWRGGAPSPTLGRVSADPRTWPEVVPTLQSGAAALAFLAEARAAYPSLLAGAGAPVLDPLLELPGFVEAWRGAADRDLARDLGFRLAVLGRIADAEVDPATVATVARDLVSAPWMDAELDAAARVYGEAWRPALAAALLDAPPPIRAALVRRALPAATEALVSLALRSDDALGLLDALDDDGWAALERRATTLAAGTDDPWVARGALAVFLCLARSGRAAPPPLVAPWALRFTSDFPEEPSPLTLEALGRLPEDARATLLAGATPFAWMFASTSSDRRVVDAAVRALEGAVGELDVAWAIRTFERWGAPARPALASSRAEVARRIEEALDAYAARARAPRRAGDVAPPLARAIEAALDALDADPAAWPPRRLQFPVLAFGEAEEPSPDEGPRGCGSWASVETFASFAPPEMVAGEIRRLARGQLGRVAHAAHDPPPARDPRTARVLLALARMVLPAWEAVFPSDPRVRAVIDDAAAILGGGAAARTDERRELHEEAYDEGDPSPARDVAYAAARVAIWAHACALDDGENDEQDTPGDLAVWSFTSIPAHGETRIERARVFWERFFLEVVPASAAP